MNADPSQTLRTPPPPPLGPRNLRRLFPAQMPSCPPWGVVDEAQLESTSVCQRLLLGLLPEAQPAVELAESLARDFNQEYDLWAAAATSEVRDVQPHEATQTNPKWCWQWRRTGIAARDMMCV